MSIRHKCTPSKQYDYLYTGLTVFEIINTISVLAVFYFLDVIRIYFLICAYSIQKYISCKSMSYCFYFSNYTDIVLQEVLLYPRP